MMLLVEYQQRQERAHARRRQPGEDRQRVDEALVEDAQDQVDDEHRGQEQQPEPFTVSAIEPPPAAKRCGRQ